MWILQGGRRALPGSGGCTRRSWASAVAAMDRQRDGFLCQDRVAARWQNNCRTNKKIMPWCCEASCYIAQRGPRLMDVVRWGKLGPGGDEQLGHCSCHCSGGTGTLPGVTQSPPGNLADGRFPCSPRGWQGLGCLLLSVCCKLGAAERQASMAVEGVRCWVGVGQSCPGDRRPCPWDAGL